MREMKIALTLLIAICYVVLCEGTLNHVKAKLKLSTLNQPIARYLASPLVLPEPVAYPSPLSTFSSHATTYNAVPRYASSYSIYKPSYSAPVVFRSAVAVPVPIYKKPLAIYKEPPVIHYEEPVAVVLETSAIGEHFIEGRYSTPAAIWDK